LYLETNLHRVREIVAHPEVFNLATGLDSVKEYQPAEDGIYFRVGSGLVYYEPRGVCVEMFAALRRGDMPRKPVDGLHEQWRYLSTLGYHTVYAFAKHQRSRMMCRAAGMRRETKKTNLFSKVIYGRSIG